MFSLLLLLLCCRINSLRFRMPQFGFAWNYYSFCPSSWQVLCNLGSFLPFDHAVFCFMISYADATLYTHRILTAHDQNIQYISVFLRLICVLNSLDWLFVLKSNSPRVFLLLFLPDAKVRSFYGTQFLYTRHSCVCELLLLLLFI